MTNLLTELNRRNVTRVALLYAGASWLVIQIAETVLPIFDVSMAFLRLLIILLAIGFIVTVVLAWFYDVARDDPTRHQADGPPSRRGMNLTIGVVLAAALFAFFVNQAGWIAFGNDGESAAAASTPTARSEAAAPERDLVRGVAVLPLENLSEAQENAFFATGVHDEILTNLAGIQEFRVISRTSVRGYAGTKLRIPEIARELGVSHVMEGSVRRSQDRVRVTVLLIDALKDQQIWSESYDRTLVDIFAIQSDIARQIVTNIQGELSPELYERIGNRSTTNTAAYDLYLRARSLSLSDVRSATILEEPLALIEEALRMDPGFVEAWVELVRICGGMVWWDRRQHRACAADALEQVRVLAPESPRRLLAEGVFAYRVERDYGEAFETLRSLQAELPNDVTLLEFIGYSARRLGRWDQALTAMRELIRLDPNAASRYDDLAVTLAASGAWQEGVRFARESSSRFPDNRVLPFIATDLERQYTGDLTRYADAMHRLPPELRVVYGNVWIDGVFPDHEDRRRWVAEAVRSGHALSLFSTRVEATYHLLSGNPEEARALGREGFRQMQVMVGDDWEQETILNLALLATTAADAGEGKIARRAIALHEDFVAKYPDQMMEHNHIFVLHAMARLGDLDRAWQKYESLRELGLGPTVWDLRQDAVLRFYFSGYPPYEALMTSPIN